MNGHADNYSERLQAFRDSDKERDELFGSILKNYQDLQAKYDQKCDDYENEIESRRTWQNNAREYNRELTTLRQASVRLTHIVFLFLRQDWT
jgi:DNA repair exonuclease SbcCD ATPase subunit